MFYHADTATGNSTVSGIQVAEALGLYFGTLTIFFGLCVAVSCLCRPSKNPNQDTHAALLTNGTFAPERAANAKMVAVDMPVVKQ